MDSGQSRGLELCFLPGEDLDSWPHRLLEGLTWPTSQAHCTSSAQLGAKLAIFSPQGHTSKVKPDLEVLPPEPSYKSGQWFKKKSLRVALASSPVLTVTSAPGARPQTLDHFRPQKMAVFILLQEGTKRGMIRSVTYSSLSLGNGFIYKTGLK